ncbi:MAG: SMC-Scp complex subunit ScpB [Planctomycetes bacterium]|nr:SMC-Scp complex subunit ScpB [Planctomycetota bacterium]
MSVEKPSSDDAPPQSPSSEPEALVPILEALFFASPEPLGMAALRKVFGEDVAKESLQASLELLRERTAEPGRGVLLVEVAGGWQFLTREEYFAWVRRIAKTRAEERITPAAIETLSVIAYKQPVTRAEIDAVRGVASGPLVRSLMDRGLVRVVGRAELPGSPFLYGTTKQFLEHFGLKSVRDLPDPKELGRLLAENANGS